MPTDIRKLNIDDLLGRLYYANVNHEWDEGDAIKAEIARRIEVRDIIIADALEDAPDDTYVAIGTHTKGRAVLARRGEDYTCPPTYYIDGEQIL